MFNYFIWFSNLSILSVPDKIYSRNASCTLYLVSTFSLFDVHYELINRNICAKGCLKQIKSSNGNTHLEFSSGLHVKYIRIYFHKITWIATFSWITFPQCNLRLHYSSGKRHGYQLYRTIGFQRKYNFTSGSISCFLSKLYVFSVVV